MLFMLPHFGNFSFQATPIEWVNIGIEDDVIKVPNEDSEAGQDSFVIVNSKSHVHGPARLYFRHAELEPNTKARRAHDKSSPNDGPIFQFLRIAEAGEAGFDFADSRKVTRVLG